MTKYYYVTNKDLTTYEGFRPFENDPNYAEAPDWLDEIKICGNALHVVSDNPANALMWVRRNYPIAHEVEPIDLKPLLAGKHRCRALKRIKTLSDDEFIKFFMQFNYIGNKANMACENNRLDCLNACIKSKILPTSYGADMACKNGHIDCLNRCIELGILPTLVGADWASINGYLNILNMCIELGILPTSWGADMACKNGHIDCLNRCIEVEVKPTSWGADWAAGGGHLDCLDRCIGLGILPTSKGVDLAVKGKHFDCVFIGVRG